MLEFLLLANLFLHLRGGGCAARSGLGITAQVHSTADTAEAEPAGGGVRRQGQDLTLPPKSCGRSLPSWGLSFLSCQLSRGPGVG